MSKPAKLTPKMLEFCRQYLVDLNGRAAARRAGYAAKRAKQTAADLMMRPEVKAEIARLQAERAERTGLEADRVVLELTRIAFSDPRKAFTEGGHLRPIHELDDDTARAVAAIKVTNRMGPPDGPGGRREPEDVVEIRFWDKNSAADKLMKHLGAYAADKPKEEVSPQQLLGEVFWRFVMALHVHRGMPLESARLHAQQNPGEVEDWGREVRLLPARESK